MFGTKTFLVLAIMAASVRSEKFWTNYTIDTVKYFQMPALNKFEDYESCLETYKDKARYCYVKTAIKPDSSELYTFIKEFSDKKKQHFRHDKLARGVCINSCQELIDGLGSEAEKYFVPFFGLDYKLNFDFIGFVNASEDREKYNRIVNQCINVEMMEFHDLKSFSSIEYCTQKEVHTKIDGLDIFFITSCCILMATIYISSRYDESLRVSKMRALGTKIEAEDHFKQTPATMAQKFMVAFSVHRNWYILSAPTRKEMRDLRSISGARIWTMIAIIYGHCSWFSVAVPIQNPYYVEKSYHQLASMIVINGGNLVQSFFFISGFLNSIVLLDYVDKNQIKGWTVLLKTFAYRVVRFFPVLLFLVIMNATFLYRFDSGPFWDKFNYFERQACRENMWTNFLFINNYVSGDMKCMVHTWFISADLHLSLLATGLLLLVVNFPKRRNLILFGSVAVSFVISFIHFYVKKLEPILILSPETLRNQLIETSPYDRYFYDFHSPTHLNTGNYFIGVVIGYYYYQYRQAGYRHRQNPFLHVTWHLSYVATYLLCFVGIYFYENDIEKGFVSALIGATLKHIYAPILGILLVGIFYRYGHFIPKIFNYGMYRLLARLSFSVYMVHVTVGALIISGQNHPIEMNNATLNAFTSAVYVLSHGAALCLAVCIEVPAHVIHKIILNDIIEKKNKTVPPVTSDGNNNKGFELGASRKKEITPC